MPATAAVISNMSSHSDFGTNQFVNMQNDKFKGKISHIIEYYYYIFICYVIGFLGCHMSIFFYCYKLAGLNTVFFIISSNVVLSGEYTISITFSFQILRKVITFLYILNFVLVRMNASRWWQEIKGNKICSFSYVPDYEHLFFT